MSTNTHDPEVSISRDRSWPMAPLPPPRCALRFGSFMHPTHAVLALSEKEDFAWTSRDHRKHRHVATSPHTGRPRHAEGTLRKIANMRNIEYWNISWWVAVLFTVGSIVWVINGFYAFLPFVNTSVPENMDAVGWTAWLGATIFEFAETGDDSANASPREKSQHEKRKWIWFSASGKYFHELGFLAAFVQYWAATIFWISGFTAIPTIQNAIMPHTGVLDGVFWTPQVVGGSGFIIASAMMMIETQRRWYVPAPLSLGWHVGFWNLVGGVGFTLCGGFGYALNQSNGIAYQSSCSTFWGGWAFLIGSIIQWYECVNPIT
ncbi:hypothetical protein C8F01DRAFT_1163582 [Mycena amicta]|nr:hypothetical protein C8F01DRAFT_1163582 [Mycena amicta]